jgi:hypothetical protein
VQARWGHLNRSYSALTIAQSLGVDGDFGVEQSARSWSGLLMNFNGTAGVWRRAAIVGCGGLDLRHAHRGPRPELPGPAPRVDIVYRPDIVCPAELPVLVTGFKSQQRRWAMGSIQTAVKLLPEVWKVELPLWTRYQAFVHLTYYMIHPLMLVSVLLAIPLRATSDLAADSPVRLVAGIVFGLATLGPATMLVYAQRVLHAAGWRSALRLPTIMVIGVGVALSTTVAMLGAFVGGRREFVRTPKFGIDGSPDLIAEGERWWTQSPDPGNPVACVTCHWEPSTTRARMGDELSEMEGAAAARRARHDVLPGQRRSRCAPLPARGPRVAPPRRSPRISRSRLRGFRARRE